ncbi:hypothetical protein GFM14_24265 [Rhizobium leguminosarum bv. viciae]|nr:hypothetical protein [Rhizobium leguminosarum bv. viciae]TBZ40324.1 hypothetical protein E0H44_23700 [Rhizobium leguminosarum bv. viciae]TCA00480.1 hypothetical protein E0H68_37795 [Rhizobium leguminosarum bv. viciae]TCA19508.1 hypothetical protein E0H67_25130 [Rhizobium leguminosarum bv. viciae]
MIGFLPPNPMLPTLFLLSIRRRTCPLRNRMKRLCSNFSTKATLGKLPTTPNMDRQRFTREVLTGYSNIAKTSLVSSQQG